MTTLASNVTIVGGGSVAVSFLYQLLERLPEQAGLGITLFEPAASVGPGGAYQADLSSNLLNIPAGRMSAIAADPDSFLRWLADQPARWLQEQGVHGINAGDFVPRPVFGVYLSQLYAQAWTMAQQRGITLRHVRETVVGVWPQDDGSAIAAGELGTRVRSSHVVLCNGNLPSVAFAQISACPGYFNSPYPVSELTRRIGKDDAVCIVGSSLSAIDTIAALAASGHRGRIDCVSRNGRLPAVRSPHNRSVKLPQLPEPQAEGRVTLDGLLASLRRALREAGGKEDANDVLGLPGAAGPALDAEIAQSQAGPRPWQAVAAATNERIEHIWHALDEAERARFHRDWRTLWMARRATFPMRNALTLQQLMHQDRLHVHGGFRSVKYDAAQGRFIADLGTSAVSAPWLVNATSFSMNVSDCADPMINTLRHNGHAQAHPLGGMDLDFDSGCLLDRDGRKVEAITVLGSLAAGTYFWTTSMEVNARLAAGQAQQIAAVIAQRSSACAQPLPALKADS